MTIMDRNKGIESRGGVPLASSAGSTGTPGRGDGGQEWQRSASHRHGGGGLMNSRWEPCSGAAGSRPH